MIALFFICFFIYFVGLFVFISKRKHLLLILLSMEYVVISIYFIFILFLRFFDYEFFLSIVFLAIRVCEGALGLSILVLIMRFHGNDYILTFSSLW